MDTKNTILEAMKKANKPLRPGEIAEMTGIDKKEVEKTLKQLVSEEKIYSPKRCFYQSK